MAHTVTFTFFDTALAANVVLVSAHPDGGFVAGSEGRTCGT